MEEREEQLLALLQEATTALSEGFDVEWLADANGALIGFQVRFAVGVAVAVSPAGRRHSVSV